MRRIFLIISILVLCLALIFTFSACKETKKPVSEQKGEQTSQTDKPQENSEEGESKKPVSEQKGEQTSQTDKPQENSEEGESKNMKIELKNVNPLSGFVAPATTTVEYQGKTYTKYYADDISLFKYCGAWQAEEEDPHTMITYWTVSYVEIDFTGSEILLDFTKKSTFDMCIDNGNSVNKTAEGLYLVQVENGNHTIRIYTRGNHKRVYFGGAAIPAGQSLKRTAKRAHYVQFIGDSITQNNSYVPKVAQGANWDFSMTAQGAIALRTGYGALAHFSPVMVSKLGAEKVKVGMEEAFFKLEIPTDSVGSLAEIKKYLKYHDEPEKFDYHFKTGYYPDIVFIFLGTNDKLDYPSEQDFTNRYNTFVSRILEVYGKNTKVYLMQGLNGTEGKYHCISAAANKIMSNYPENVFFIDRTTVDSWGVEMSTDNLHPSDNGYSTLANSIIDYLKKYN